MLVCVWVYSTLPRPCQSNPMQSSPTLISSRHRWLRAYTYVRITITITITSKSLSLYHPNRRHVLSYHSDIHTYIYIHILKIKLILQVLKPPHRVYVMSCHVMLYYSVLIPVSYPTNPTQPNPILNTKNTHTIIYMHIRIRIHYIYVYIHAHTNTTLTIEN